MPECSNYAARGALIAVIACVYREAIPALPPAAGKSRGATEKKGDRILARRGGGGGEGGTRPRVSAKRRWIFLARSRNRVRVTNFPEARPSANKNDRSGEAIETDSRVPMMANCAIIIDKSIEMESDRAASRVRFGEQIRARSGLASLQQRKQSSESMPGR